MIKQMYLNQSNQHKSFVSIKFKCQTILFDPYQILLLWARVDLGKIAVEEYFAFSKTLVFLEPHHQIVKCHMLDNHGGGSYSFAETKLVYSTPAPANWAIQELEKVEQMWGCPRGVMVKAMDCGIVVREFVLQSRYYVHFRANTLGKGMNPLTLTAMG